MIKCPKCGAENPEGSDFCKNCGSPMHEQKAENAKSKKTISGKQLAIFSAIAVAIIVIAVFLMNSAKTINLNNYLVFETKGYDGYGKATVTLDRDKLEKDHAKHVKFKGIAKKELGDMLGVYSPLEAMLSYVDVDIENSKDLHNGDEVKYKWNVDKDIERFFDVKLKYKDGSYTVSDLEEIGSTDVFENLTVTFSGISGDGTAELKYKGEGFSSYDFSIDKRAGLSNGDVVTVTIDDSSAESYARSTGKMPSPMSKEYTVEGLVSRLESMKQTSEDNLQPLKNQADDVFKAHVAKVWDSEHSFLKGMTYIGNYILSPKSYNYGERNYMYLIYKIDARNELETEDETFKKDVSYYWWIAFNNLKVDENGEIEVNLTDYRTPSRTFVVDSGIDNRGWYYNGYEELEELKRVEIESSRDKYSYEENISE